MIARIVFARGYVEDRERHTDPLIPPPPLPSPGFKMAMGRKNLQIRGHRTRRARIRVWVCTRGRGRWYEFKPDGYLLTDFKI